ncbi:MAG: hypothetical protein JO261_02635 [Alphaproteobacteria bacterium]|nr:hypothetical protein [Alphaproteobacteria bacterium]MBV9692575.1 hypothetical protein [Alphaproteobacteria bacterium]
MRRRTKLGLMMSFATLAVLVITTSNWLLAALVGMGIGVIFFVFTHAYPNDIAPPSDRRHENTQRRRSAQRDSAR